MFDAHAQRVDENCHKDASLEHIAIDESLHHRRKPLPNVCIEQIFYSASACEAMRCAILILSNFVRQVSISCQKVESITSWLQSNVSVFLTIKGVAKF